MHKITAALLSAFDAATEFAAKVEGKANAGLEELHARAVARVEALAQAAVKLAEAEREALGAQFMRLLAAADSAVEGAAEKLRAVAAWAEAERAKIGR